MRTKFVGIAVAATLGTGIANAEERIAICHLPPGNPTDAHTIIVGKAALDAHFGHGDEAGECPTGCQLDPTLCDDGNACTSDPCDANGECGTAAVDCDDSDFCTDDGCDPGSGCTYGPTTNPPEASEASCDDELDNDCDGAADAEDADCTGFCGDGITQPELGEQCDDGNTNPFDGCDQCITVDTTPD